MSIPTRGEAYAKLMEHLRLAQEESATLAHLARANSENMKAQGWLAVSEMFKRVQHTVTELATKGMH